MDPRRYQQIKAILVDALELPAAERPSFLSSACGDDADLRAEVESLLEYEAQDGFLDPLVPESTFGDLDAWQGQAGPADTASDDSRVGRTFSHYRVTSRIGDGGMGVVYLAEDVHLGRSVALKFLKPELTADEDLDARFAREARAIASLDHPNICTLYGIERTPDGQVFLAIAYYPGETLEARLSQGPLSWKTSIDIARQVGNGLAAAHAAGIVHRDIKPGNVMLINGVVKILDFGIAKLTDHAGLTLPGIRLGTAAYASPEQAEGGLVDHRTDIWSLGVTLYEMLTGRRPFSPGQFGVAPVPIRRLRSDVPPDLETIILRALSVDPARRYSSMGDFVSSLRSVRPPRDESVPLAITPFVSAAAVEADETLGEALAEATADCLSAASGLTIIWSDPSVGRPILATHVLTGLVSSSTGSINIAVTLHDTGSGTQRSCELTRSGHDVAWLITDLARAVLEWLEVNVTADEEREIVRHQLASAEWYLPFVEGRALLRRDSEAEWTAAVERFEQSIAAAPSEAFPCAALVEGCVRLLEKSCSPGRHQLADTARSALRQALELDASATPVQFAAAEVDFRVEWSPAVAEERLRNILESRPGHGRAALRLAECLVTLGDPGSAIDWAKRAAVSDPCSVHTLLRAGRVLHFAGDLEGSIGMYEAALEVAPDSHVGRLDLALTFAKSGQRSRAQSECDRALASAEGRTLMAAALGSVARANGDSILYELSRQFVLELFGVQCPHACCLALLDTSFGDTGRPLEYLESYDETEGLARFLGLAPIQGSLSTLIESVGLIAYLGIDPAFRCLDESASVRTLLNDIRTQTRR